MIRFQQAQQALNMAAVRYSKGILIGAASEVEEELASAAEEYINECARMSGISVEEFLKDICMP